MPAYMLYDYKGLLVCDKRKNCEPKDEQSANVIYERLIISRLGNINWMEILCKRVVCITSIKV